MRDYRSIHEPANGSRRPSRAQRDPTMAAGRPTPRDPRAAVPGRTRAPRSLPGSRGRSWRTHGRCGQHRGRYGRRGSPRRPARNRALPARVAVHVHVRSRPLGRCAPCRAYGNVRKWLTSLTHFRAALLHTGYTNEGERVRNGRRVRLLIDDTTKERGWLEAHRHARLAHRREVSLGGRVRRATASTSMATPRRHRARPHRGSSRRG